jgi:cyclophilin family peptidyl-prolyl cis-trans isomerase
MSSSRRPGRRVPPKGRALRSDPVPPAASDSEATTTERRTRAQNRAAKRAVGGVRPKTSGGRVRAGGATRGSNMGLVVLAVIAVAVVAAVVVIGNPFGSAGPSAAPSSTPSATRQLTGCPTTVPAPLAATDKRTVTIQTAKGNIVIEVDPALAPVAAANFVALAQCGYYDGVIFHRVVPDFVIQGGDGQFGWIGALDRNRVGQGGLPYQFADEPIKDEYTRGTVAMANSGPDTNEAQFFICTADDTAKLQKAYTIFGHVTSGMDVVDQIVAAPRNAKDLPDDPVAMDHVVVTIAPGASASPAPTAPPTPASTIAPSAAPTTP